ncbi:MAG: CDP-glycerol--glycerophosphate glycerophosphotransferase [Ruminococcaceae bacterium]|nr:CDP-glycerol--glycerophosphate glycerophosphotransferase [Oscillospiraceae bacterium]
MRLYIDPGTGSMLFTILIGVIGAAVYSLRMLFIKLRFKLSGGKVETGMKKTPFVIFSDDKRYWKIFEPVIREMSKRGKEVHYITNSADDPALEAAIPGFTAEHPETENKSFTKLNFLNASVLLSTTPGLDVYQWKRSKDVDFYVHIPHAPNEIVLYRMFGIDYYDAILVSGDYQKDDLRALEKMRGLPEKEIVKVGIPYMDEMAKRLEAEGPAPEHERTVLLAPSWGQSAILSVYGERIFEVLLKTGYHIIVRPHPQSFASEKELIERLMKKYPDSDRIEWNRDTDNFDVLRRSDILISDFSGVIFDFSLIYDKPVIYTDPKFDVSLYDAWWLKDSTLWTVSALPRIGRELKEENMEDLKGLIDSCLEDPRYAEGRRQVKEETWAYAGEGAVRVADYLINKYEEINKEKEGK